MTTTSSRAAAKANALFLLDVGSSMAFTPNGKLPEIDKLPHKEGAL